MPRIPSKGEIKAAATASNGQATPNSGVSASKLYLGKIKDPYDGRGLHRVRVYIPDLGGAESDPSSWHNCVWTSPFIGSTSPYNNKPSSQNYTDTASSYGFWMQPPDTENMVVVAFLNGNTANGVVIACMSPEFNDHMVPGIANAPTFSGSTFDSSGLIWPSSRGARPTISGPPAAEYNKQDPKSSVTGPKPAIMPMLTTLLQQGLYLDPERGSTTASIARENPSRVYGFSTPGGFQVYTDEGPATYTAAANYNTETLKTQTVTPDTTAPRFIRLKTPSGGQILLNDNVGYVYINSPKGNSWISITDDTNGVNVYSFGSVSVRSQNDLNLHADKNINIEAGNNINLKTQTGNIVNQATQSFSVLANQDIYFQSTGSMNLTATTEINAKSSSSISLIAALNLTANATNLQLNGPPGPSPEPALPLTATSTPDVGVDFSGSGGHSSTTQQSIVSTLPTHEPFGGHPIPHNPALPLNAGAGAGYTGAATASATAATTPTPQSLSCQDSQCLVAIAQLTPSQDAVTLVKKEEGAATNAQGLFNVIKGPSNSYIGYGHVLNATEQSTNMVTISGQSVNVTSGITDSQASALLLSDLNVAGQCVRQRITVQVTQAQFDAMCSFAMSVGCTTFLTSGIPDQINNCQHNSVPQTMQTFVSGGGQDQAGLAARRQAEGALFSTTPTQCQRQLPVTSPANSASGCCQNIMSSGGSSDVKLSQFFTLSQLTASNTARAQGIDNSTTDPTIITNLCNLANNVLDNIRNQYPSMIVTSGYRSPALNRAVGGVGNSQHATGQAADMQFPGFTLQSVFSWIQNNINYDQLIFEHNSSTTWIHCSYSGANNRNVAATLTQGGAYSVVNSQGTGAAITS